MQKPLTFLASVVISAALSLPATAQDKPSIDQVVAIVNDTEITLGHMIIARASLPEQYRQLPDEVLFTGILDQLVQQAALADSYEGDLPARVSLSIENELRSLTAGEVIERNMASPLSEDDVQAAYDEQYANAEAGEEYNASHILVETEEAAIALKEELDSGADFAALAREKSTGPSGPGGGSLGWFGKGMMVPSFEAAVVAMEPGAVSDPVQTQFGWHVIKLNETRKTEAPSLESVREELELQLRQTRVQTTIEDVTAAADVDRSGAEGLDPAILKDLELLE
ncbi:peptidylprolyl isomerase [uncultured Sulfitobacter sp.]|uniref:peptidylprolyl isomerase n=1 Tax=uncultured Sulfitobacter sp. TaxID=191468 RepID=UPI00260F48D7|nr:peptidylprolyl isomerase [uncultured Sulfitobacter sp.]